MPYITQHVILIFQNTDKNWLSKIRRRTSTSQTKNPRLLYITIYIPSLRYMQLHAHRHIATHREQRKIMLSVVISLCVLYVCVHAHARARLAFLENFVCFLNHIHRLLPQLLLYFLPYSIKTMSPLPTPSSTICAIHIFLDV